MSEKIKILGEHLMPVFERIGIYPKNIYYGKIDKFEHFEVWELTPEEFAKMNSISHDRYHAILPDGSWWAPAAKDFDMQGE